MGRPKPKQKTKKSKELLGGSHNTKKSSNAVKTTASNYTVDQLLDKAEELIDAFDYEVAQKFCQRALELDVDNVRALETSGTLLLESGNPEAAKQCFGRAVELSPEKGHSKYMSLGQLFEGQQAIQCYQKGIELMVNEMEEHQQQQVAAACAKDERQKELCRSISSAYCSVAEIYMTDCCDDDGAEDFCKGAIEKGIESDGTNPEAYQLLASYLLVKQEKENAKDAINKSVSLWLPKFKDREKSHSDGFDPVEGSFGENDQMRSRLLNSGVVIPTAGILNQQLILSRAQLFKDILATSLPFQAVPLTYQTRIQTAQILTEVEEYHTAFEILEALLDEDDEVIQVWYMLGLLNHLQGAEHYSNARHYLAKAKELSQKVPCDDQPMLKHIDELLEELGPGEDEEEIEAEAADDDEWEDMDSSDEDEEAMEAS